MTARRLLVTGASGFVGRHVVSAAAAVGFEVHALSRHTVPDELRGIAHWHGTDLLADGASAALMKSLRPSHILHAAWVTAQGTYWTSPDNQRWVAATNALARAFAEAGGGRFVMVGSSAEYDWSHGVMIEDVTPLSPHTPYGAAKLAAHRDLQDLAAACGVSAVTGRLFFAFGPHENAERLVPYVCGRLACGETAVLSLCRQIRDFMHVEDVARALVTLLESDATGAINIGLGEPTRLSEIVAILGRTSGRADLLHLGGRPERPDDVPILVPDVRRLRGLGWTPRIPLEDGLTETYAWWAERMRSR